MPVNANTAPVNGNGSTTNNSQPLPQRPSKPPPPGPAPPAPVANANANTSAQASANNAVVSANGSAVAKVQQNMHPPPAVNGSHSQKGKKRADTVDPAAMYESLKNRIAALEEEEVHADEEERRISEFLVAYMTPLCSYRP